jgi:hypothetical protein
MTQNTMGNYPINEHVFTQSGPIAAILAMIPKSCLCPQQGQGFFLTFRDARPAHPLNRFPGLRVHWHLLQEALHLKQMPPHISA